MLPPYSLDQAIDRIIREERGRILACIVSTAGDLQLAEDSLQDAVETALMRWSEHGVPSSPAAWLITVARRKAIDRMRSDAVLSAKQSEISYLAELQGGGDDPDQLNDFPDKRLELIFTCCHPALARKTQVALTLRTIGGLTTGEIARAFLDQPAALAQRLVRAKNKIRLAGIPYEIPGPEAFPSRIKQVMSVIYLIFNEGYQASSGSRLVRVDLIEEALRIARIMHHLLPDETEVAGLLALMLLHHARSSSRTDADGVMIQLQFQNRTKWDRARISEGVTLLKKQLQKGRVGPYQLQAAISAVHVESESWEETDWVQISTLYQLLLQIQPSPVIAINHAMAVSYAQSLDKAKSLLDQIGADKAMQRYVPYYLARADVCERAGERQESMQLLKQASQLTDNDIEREFICKRIHEIGG